MSNYFANNLTRELFALSAIKVTHFKTQFSVESNLDNPNKNTAKTFNSYGLLVAAVCTVMLPRF